MRNLKSHLEGIERDIFYPEHPYKDCVFKKLKICAFKPLSGTNMGRRDGKERERLNDLSTMRKGGCEDSKAKRNT